MNCNPYSSVIGFNGVSASNGAITSMTVKAVPVNGGVSAAQRSAWAANATWFDGLTAVEGVASG